MAESNRPKLLCTGIAVQDLIWRVTHFPPPAGKASASEFVRVTGGCAVNAAIAMARLGGQTFYSGPLGGADDPVSNAILADLGREGVDCSGVVRVAAATAPISGIFIDASGERMISTCRDHRIEAARAADPAALVAGMKVVLADNRYPDFVSPICLAARRQDIPVVLDADKPTKRDDPLLMIPSHVIFSAEALRATTGENDLAHALRTMTGYTTGFLAVSDGAEDILYLAGGEVKRLSVFVVNVVDTLAAGDVLHAGFALALAEGRDEAGALKFGAAAASLKCSQFGGSQGAPQRAEVEQLLTR